MLASFQESSFWLFSKHAGIASGILFLVLFFQNTLASFQESSFWGFFSKHAGIVLGILFLGLFFKTRWHRTRNPLFGFFQNTLASFPTSRYEVGYHRESASWLRRWFPLVCCHRRGIHQGRAVHEGSSCRCRDSRGCWHSCAEVSHDAHGYIRRSS